MGFPQTDHNKIIYFLHIWLSYFIISIYNFKFDTRHTTSQTTFNSFLPRDFALASRLVVNLGIVDVRLHRIDRFYCVSLVILLASTSIAEWKVFMKLALLVAVPVNYFGIMFFIETRNAQKTYMHVSIVTYWTNSLVFKTFTSLSSNVEGSNFGIIVFLVLSQSDSSLASSSSNLVTSVSSSSSSHMKGFELILMFVRIDCDDIFRISSTWASEMTDSFSLYRKLHLIAV